MMRLRSFVITAVTVIVSACNPGNLPLPVGHQLSCEANADCPSGLVCDPDIMGGRCVASIAPAPTVTLETDTLVGTRNDTFEFTAAATNADTFEWDYIAGAGDVVRLNETSRVVQHRFSELGVREFCENAACEDAVAVRLRVTVRSDEGKTAFAETTLVVINDAPIADFGDDLFISEQNVASVTIDWCGGGKPDAGCTSTDPDGDELQFLGFTQVEGPSVGPLGDGGVVTFAPPQGPHRPLVFEGVVTDGIQRSVGRISVNRGSHGWVAVGTIDATFRVHPDFRAVQSWVSGMNTERFYGPTLVEPDGVGGWWVADSYPPATGRSLVIHVDATLREIASDRFDVPGVGRFGSGLESPLRAFVPPRAGSSGCLAFRRDPAGGGAEPGFARFVPGQPLSISHFSVKLDGGFHQPVAVHRVGSSANCWAVRLDEGEGFNSTGGAVAQLTESGQWVSEQPLAGFPGPSAVEADGTLWIAERFPVPLPGGGFAFALEDRYRTVLTKWGPQPGTPPESFDLGMAHLIALTASPDGGLWGVESHADALVRIEPDGTLVETEMIVGGGTVFGGPALQVDGVTGDVWAIDPEASTLLRFKPENDGGVHLTLQLGEDDLPQGQNKKSFSGSGDLAVDPVSGNVSTFVGADSSSYHRFMVIPPHGRRLERVPAQNAINSQLRGDPTSGVHWVVDGYRVRRIDGRGRELLEVPNKFMERLNAPPPTVVDRSGRAWVANADGMPALRAINPDGSDGDRVMLPFSPQAGFISGSFNGTTLNEMGCFFNANGVVRVNFAASPPTVTPLTVSENVVLCAVNSSGDVWVFTTNSAMLGDITARRFRRSETIANFAQVAERQQLNNASIFIMGAVADEDGETVYFGTWHFDTYFADLVHISTNEAMPRVLSVLQGNVMGVNILGIPISLGSRRVCGTPIPACTELWMSNRVSELRRYDGDGNELERITLGTGEGPLDLVP